MKLIILDRDGVINVDSRDYIKSLNDWRPIPGSLEAIAELKKAGYTIAVATNQSGVGRGYYSVEALEAIHTHMQSLLAVLGGHIDLIVYCPHLPDAACDCRKPKPGLLLQIAQKYNLTTEELKKIPFVGDNLTDVEAARAAGVRPILVKTGYRTVNAPKDVETFANLSDAVHFLLR